MKSVVDRFQREATRLPQGNTQGSRLRLLFLRDTDRFREAVIQQVGYWSRWGAAGGWR